MPSRILKKLFILTALLLLALCINGCKNSESKKQFLRWSLPSAVTALAPQKASNNTEAQVLLQLFEGLCTKNAAGDVIPGVAESWEVSDDGKKYLFHIRKGVKWSSGQNLTARDFENTWKNTLNPEAAENTTVDVLYCIKNAKAYNEGLVNAGEVGVKAIDDNTLEVTMEKQIPYFLDLLATDTKYLPVYSDNEEGFVCNGPFALQSFVPDDKLIMRKNDNYYNKAAVKIDTVECFFIDDINTNLVLFENKSLDMSDVTCPIAEQKRMYEQGKLKKSPAVYSVFFLINLQEPLMQNKELRKALSLAIDRKQITNILGREAYEPAFAFIPSGFKNTATGDDFRTEGGDLFQENVNEAKQLLAKAGYGGGSDLPVIEILYNSSSAHKMVAEIIQNMWQNNLGVKTELVNKEMKIYEQSIENADFMCARASWFREYADPLTYLNILRSDNRNNRMFYKNAQYDRLIYKAQNASDTAERFKTLHEAEQMIIDDMAVIPLYFVSDTYLESPAVHGVIRDGTGGVWLREAFKTAEE